MYKNLVSFVCAAIVVSGCATSSPKQETLTVYRKFDVAKNVALNDVISMAKKALSVRASNVTATTGLAPDNLPAAPASFKLNMKQMAFGPMMMTFPVVKCSDATSIITNSGGFSAGGSSESERYTACVYPYQAGTSVQFVLITTTTHQGGLQGMMNSAVKGMFGGNEGTAETYMDQISKEFTKDIPVAKLVKTSKPETSEKSKS